MCVNFNVILMNLGSQENYILESAESMHQARSKKCKAFLIWHIKWLINNNLVSSTYNSLSIELDLSFLPYWCKDSAIPSTIILELN